MTESTETALSKKSLLNRCFWIKVIRWDCSQPWGRSQLSSPFSARKNAPPDAEQTARTAADDEKPRALLSSQPSSYEASPGEVARAEKRNLQNQPIRDPSTKSLPTRRPVLSPVGGDEAAGFCLT